MTDTLSVRFYNVRFGDAILVTVPDKNPLTNAVKTRRILIDFGNAPLVASPDGGDDSVFKPAVDRLIADLAGDPIDLYVLTHEHLDHAQGLPHAVWKTHPNLLQTMPINFAWLPGSAHPTYYDTHPDAKKKKLAFENMYNKIYGRLMLEGEEQLPPSFRRFLAINNPASTKACVEFLRNVAGTTSYVHRSVGQPAGGTPLFDVTGTHPFEEAHFEVWAPEEDTSGYYGAFQPLSIADPVPSAGPGAAPSLPPRPLPPPGVDAGAFYNLVDTRLSGIGDNMLAIDKAANNSSVVFLLEWRGWRLLFAGDAEIRSWKTMKRERALKPVHFLKVSHHGSHNGTPEDELFEAILPAVAGDTRPRTACISTWRNTYSGIPHDPTDQRLKSRCDLRTTLDDENAPAYDVTFPG